MNEYDEIKITIKVNDKTFSKGIIFSNVENLWEAVDFLIGSIKNTVKPEVEKYLERRNSQGQP